MRCIQLTFVTFALCISKLLYAQTTVNKNSAVYIDAYEKGVARINVERNLNDNIDPFLSNYQRKWGLIDRSGRLIADTIYDYVSEHDENGIFVLVHHNKIGLIDTTGKIISPFVYDTDLRLWPEPKFKNGLLPILSAVHHFTGSTHFLRYPFIYPKIGFISNDGSLVIDSVFQLETLLGDSQAYLFNAGNSCGTGMRHAHMVAAKYPYYLKQGYYDFAGNRCLTVRDGVNIVINERGDSLYSINIGFEWVKNMDGCFKIIKPTRYYNPDSATSLLYDKSGHIYYPKPNEEIIDAWNGYPLIRIADKSDYHKDVYKFIDPATGKTVFGKTFSYAGVQNGNVYTNLGILDKNGNITPIR